MMLFGSPGFGEAMDGCCDLIVLAALSVICGAALAGGSRRSVSTVAFAFLLAGIVGAVVVREAFSHELRDTDDSRGVHATVWQYVWWWAASLCAPITAAVVLLFRSRRFRSEPSNPSRA